jgi:hypothetical protein
MVGKSKGIGYEMQLMHSQICRPYTVDFPADGTASPSPWGAPGYTVTPVLVWAKKKPDRSGHYIVLNDGI